MKRKTKKLYNVPVQYYNSILGVWIDYSTFREFKKESTKPAEKLKN